MLQRQVEVAGALRAPPKTSDELLRTRLTMKGLAAFLTQLNRIATKLQLPLEAVFQCLMQIGLGHADGVDFDKQHRSGNVPMHQAKVLDRNATLNAQKVEPKVREVVDEDTLHSHVALCSELRTLLRMKVEDGNDLSMARKLVVLSEEYLDCIFNLAQGDGATMMKLYLADDSETIHALTGGSSPSRAIGAFSGGGPASHCAKPPPANIVKGITEECRGVLDDVKSDFPKRQKSLSVVKGWLQQLDADQLERHFLGIIGALHEPLRAQLGDKRSVICRLACDIVSMLLLRVRNVHEVVHMTKTKEVLASWIDVLLKSVFVTVAALAEATDLTMRDVIVTTRPVAGFMLHILGQALGKAAQPELKRKLLNYILLVMAGDSQVSRLGPHELVPLLPLVLKMCNSSEEACRRVARMVLIRSEDLGCLQTAPLDPKIERAVAADRASVLDALAGPTAALEVVTLKYTTACRASTGGWIADDVSLFSTGGGSRQASTILSDDGGEGLTSTSASSASRQAQVDSVDSPPARAAHPPSSSAPNGPHSSQQRSPQQRPSSDRPSPPSVKSDNVTPKTSSRTSVPQATSEVVVVPATSVQSRTRALPPSTHHLPEIVSAKHPAATPQPLSATSIAQPRASGTSGLPLALATSTKRTSPSDSPLVSSMSTPQHLSATVPLSLRGLSASTSVNTPGDLGSSHNGSSSALSGSLMKRLSQRKMDSTPLQQ